MSIQKKSNVQLLITDYYYLITSSSTQQHSAAISSNQQQSVQHQASALPVFIDRSRGCGFFFQMPPPHCCACRQLVQCKWCPCKDRWYCSRACQEDDWCEHKLVCPYRGWKKSTFIDLSPLGEDLAALPCGRDFTVKVLSEQMQSRGSGARGRGNSHNYQPADSLHDQISIEP